MLLMKLCIICKIELEFVYTLSRQTRLKIYDIRHFCRSPKDVFIGEPAAEVEARGRTTAA